jgi:hypothetical protein
MKTGVKIRMATALVALAAGCLLIMAALAGLLPRAGAADHRDARAFGLVSVNPGQELRLNLFSLTFTGRVRRVLVAFDVYMPAASGAAPAAAGEETSCANNLRRLRMVERRSCVVTLDPSGAATVDMPARAEAVLVRPVVDPGGFDTAESQSISSLEVREGGRTTSVINPEMIISREPHH